MKKIKKPKIKIIKGGDEAGWYLTTKSIEPNSKSKQLIVFHPEEDGVSLGDGGGSSYRLSWEEVEALGEHLVQLSREWL